MQKDKSKLKIIYSKIFFVLIIFFGLFGLAKSSLAVYPVAGRRKFLLAGFLFSFFLFFAGFSFASPAYGADYYFAQSVAGSANGTSCANAYAIGDGSSTGASSSTYWVAGNTLHLCGTITVAEGGRGLTVNGSGTSGNPIAIDFCSGTADCGTGTAALITSPAMAYGIYSSGNSYITINGNGTNPSITNTANGSGLSYAVDSNGIYCVGGTNDTIENLTITNMYVHTSTSDTNGVAGGIVYTGSNISISGNTIDHAYGGIFSSYQDGDNGNNIYNNTINHTNWGIYNGNNSTGTIYNIKIHNNHIENMNNWDTTSDSFHHDGIFIVQNNTSANIYNIYIYDNLFDGDGSDCSGNSCMTAWLYFNTGIHGIYVYNNVFDFTNTTTPNAAVEGGYSGDSNYYIINNYFASKGGGTAIQIGPVTSGQFVIENNAMNNFYTYLYLSSFSGATTTINNNAYDLTGASTGHAFKVNYTGGATFSQYIAANSTYDTNSITPTSLGVSSYQPQSGSALIGAGANLTSLGITSLDTDYAGAARPSTGAWDIGAYKYSSGSSDTTPPAAPSGLSVN